MSAIPTRLPEGFEAYGRSPDSTPENLPSRLQSAHRTKAGTWGLLHVVEGTLLYMLEAPYFGDAIATAGDKIVIESEVPHHVQFVTPGRFFVEFYRAASAG